MYKNFQFTFMNLSSYSVVLGIIAGNNHKQYNNKKNN
jgi:hypothetical protein